MGARSLPFAERGVDREVRTPLLLWATSRAPQADSCGCVYVIISKSAALSSLFL